MKRQGHKVKEHIYQTTVRKGKVYVDAQLLKWRNSRTDEGTLKNK